MGLHVFRSLRIAPTPLPSSFQPPALDAAGATAALDPAGATAALDPPGATAALDPAGATAAPDAAGATAALDPTGATAALDPAGDLRARYPAWVLLDKKACLDGRMNGTTREVMTSTGQIVKVTFFLADPPSVSYFCVHSPGLDLKNYKMEPRVVFSAKDLVLFRFAFTVGPRSTTKHCNHAEYFVFKAGCGNPSIRAIPTTPPEWRSSWNAIILPCDDGEFFVADLYKTPYVPRYDLHVFSSKTDKWSTKPLQLQTSPNVMQEDLPKRPHKVIALGGDLVGWVDLWRGIVTCNVLAEDPVLSFIPLPKPEFNLSREGDPQTMRDVTSFNGFLNFIEMEHCSRELNIINRRKFKMTKHLDSEDIIYDSELLLNDMAELDEKSVIVPDGWKIRTCYRSTSWDYWRKSHTVHVDDISVNNPEHSVMLPQLWDRMARKWSLRNITMGYPILSIHGDDVVYLMSKLALYDEKAWMIGVDLKKKTVETIKPYCGMRALHFDPAFLPCAFSEYLNTNPRPCSKEGTPNWAQDCELNGHLSSGYTSPNDVVPQQNMWNANGYNGSLNEYAAAAQAGYSNYQQPTLSRPAVMRTRHTPEALYPISISSEPGYTYPMGTQPIINSVLNTDGHDRVWLPLDDRPMSLLPARSTAAPSLCPTDPLPPVFTQLMTPGPPFFSLHLTDPATLFVTQIRPPGPSFFNPMMQWRPAPCFTPVMPSASGTF